MLKTSSEQIKLKGLKEPSLVILLLLVSFPAVGAVLFTPALPLITQYFQISSGMAQMSVTVFLAGYAIGQLPWGPLSNKIGRKPVIYIGLLISVIGSLLCILSGPLHQYWLLVLARLITALGASVGLMMAFTIVSDYYEPGAARQKLAFVMAAFAVAPGTAVMLGGFVTQYFNWESTFLLEAVYSAFMIVLCARLPETSTELSKEKYTLVTVINSYITRCQHNHKLFLCGLMLGCSAAFLYVFAARGPFLCIHTLGLTPSQYGLLNLIPAVGLVLGMFLSHRTAHILSPHKAIGCGLLIMAVSSLAMLGLFAWGKFNLWTLIIPYFITNMGISFVFINTPAIGTAHAKNKPNASAVLSFLNITVCVITIIALESVISEVEIVMPIFFLGLLVLFLPLYLTLERIVRREA